ncbi:MAG: phage protein Gp36 family protein [Chlorobiota bacterium]|jgi:phage gp36-like protein
MAYSSNTDLLGRFSSEELAKLTGDKTGTTIDTARTDLARELADATIDATLLGRYSIPFTEPDELIVSISTDLTIYHLYRIEYGELPLPTEIKGYYEEANQLLDDIQSGELYLGGSVPGYDSPPSIMTMRSSDNRIYNNDVMDSYFGGDDV